MSINKVDKVCFGDVAVLASFSSLSLLSALPRVYYCFTVQWKQRSSPLSCQAGPVRLKTLPSVFIQVLHNSLEQPEGRCGQRLWLIDMMRCSDELTSSSQSRNEWHTHGLMLGWRNWLFAWQCTVCCFEWRRLGRLVHKASSKQCHSLC